MRMTSEDFASKMIEGFEPHEKPLVESNPAEKMEKKLNEAMKKEVKKVLPEEPEEKDDELVDDPEPEGPEYEEDKSNNEEE